MTPTYEAAIFKSHINGFYTFALLDSSVDMVFEEINPRILMKFNLKNDKSLLNRTFHIAYTEDIVDDEDFIIYRIEYLELINSN